MDTSKEIESSDKQKLERIARCLRILKDECRYNKINIMSDNAYLIILALETIVNDDEGIVN